MDGVGTLQCLYLNISCKLGRKPVEKTKLFVGP